MAADEGRQRNRRGPGSRGSMQRGWTRVMVPGCSGRSAAGSGEARAANASTKGRLCRCSRARLQAAGIAAGQGGAAMELDGLVVAGRDAGGGAGADADAHEMQLQVVFGDRYQDRRQTVGGGGCTCWRWLLPKGWSGLELALLTALLGAPVPFVWVGTYLLSLHLEVAALQSRLTLASTVLKAEARLAVLDPRQLLRFPQFDAPGAFSGAFGRCQGGAMGALEALSAASTGVNPQWLLLALKAAILNNGRASQCPVRFQFILTLDSL
ncbi:hypothetical protein M440DRAFT_1163468 [Trichoderma longibrachiatum ATCC 18648]|uniref:Uncharacterized protein n=1 Tax=Trichoderma longibrachiatum ATCC 18648 TaxID=983965 RepID=A0A2T4CCE2_TRILO|nr:hypothetical protein M440DRAFT_1163468 [Trichoderma longibrachiatum ATCC 18648]